MTAGSPAILTNICWSLAGRIAMVMAVFGWSAILARHLPANEFGAFLYCFSIVSVLGVVAPLGANYTMVPLVSAARHQGEVDRAARLAIAGLGLSLTAGILITVALAPLLLAGVTAMVADAAGTTLAAALAWTVGFGLQLTLSEIFRARCALPLAVANMGALSHLALAGVLIAAHGAAVPLTLSDILICQALIVAANVAIGVAQLGRDGGLCHRPHPRDLAALVGAALPLVALNGILLLMVNADVWLLARYAPPEQVALYGAAARLALLATLPSVILEGGLTPLLAGLYHGGDRRRLAVLGRAASMAGMLLSGLVLLLLTQAGEPILTLVYGPRYASAQHVLTYLALGHTVFAGAAPGLALAAIAGRQRTLVLPAGMVAGTTLAGAAAVAMTGNMAGVAQCMAAGICALALVTAALSAQQTRLALYPSPGALWREVNAAWVVMAKARQA